MNTSKSLPLWSMLSPLAGWLLIIASKFNLGSWLLLLLVVALMASVLAAVYHAEVVAHKVGEPFGTLVLALAVTLIEVALIVSLMLSGGEATHGLARDTVFAAIMIILNGLVCWSVPAATGNKVLASTASRPRWRPWLQLPY